MPQLTLHGATYDIDAILFDKDGTLLNFGDLWIGWFDQLVTTLNQSLPEAHALSHHALYPTEQRLWDPTGPLTIGSLDDIAIIVSLSLFESGVAWNDATQLSHDAIARLADTLDWPNCVTPVKGLMNFVAQARQAGISLAVVTSDDAHNAHLHLKLLSLADAFSVVLGHDQVSRGKPYPEMALLACEQLGTSPQRTLIIGDSNGDMAMGAERSGAHDQPGRAAGGGHGAAPAQHRDQQHFRACSVCLPYALRHGAVR